MKKLLSLLTLSIGLCGAVYANEPTTGLYVSGETSGFSTAGFNGIASLVGQQSFVFGTLKSAQAGTLTFSYLGSEAGHTDKFLTLNNLGFNNKLSPNTTFSMQIGAGQAVNFSFTDVSANNMSVANGANVTGWGSNDANSWQNTFGLKKETNYSYLLMYNDYVSNGDRDFDDMVVRVSLAPVPEPETYAMLLAGLGLMGAIARHRKQQAIV